MQEVFEYANRYMDFPMAIFSIVAGLLLGIRVLLMLSQLLKAFVAEFPEFEKPKGIPPQMEKAKNSDKLKNDDLVAFQWHDDVLEIVDAPENEPLR